MGYRWGIRGVYLPETCAHSGRKRKKTEEFGNIGRFRKGLFALGCRPLFLREKGIVMARQTGIFPITGTLGGLSFYRHKQYGYLVRQKGGVDGKRFREDAAFARSRENSAAFGRASQCGRVVRRALHPWLHRGDCTMVNRLTTAMLRALQADVHHPRGEQTVQDGAPEQLVGFRFNAITPLTWFIPQPQTRWDGRMLEVKVEPQDITFPAAATHVRLLTIALAVNFETLTATPTVRDRLLTSAAARTFTEVFMHPVEHADASHLFVLAGVSFYQEVSGTVSLLHDCTLHALEIVAVHALSSEAFIPQVAVQKSEHRPDVHPDRHDTEPRYLYH